MDEEFKKAIFEIKVTQGEIRQAIKTLRSSLQNLIEVFPQLSNNPHFRGDIDTIRERLDNMKGLRRR